MRDLADCSGPWSGFWLQGWTRGNMKLSLLFSGTDIMGDGNDPGGHFRINGMFSRETNRVMFTKTYQSQIVDYSGQWDGAMIYGRWVLSDLEYGEHGEFEIWPDEDHAQEMAWEGAWEKALTQPV